MVQFKSYGFITLEEENQKRRIFTCFCTLEKSKFRILKENQIIQFEIKEERGKIAGNKFKKTQK